MAAQKAVQLSEEIIERKSGKTTTKATKPATKRRRKTAKAKGTATKKTMTAEQTTNGSAIQGKTPQKTVNDYVELIETVARVEYSRLPNHLIDFSEVVNIGAIAIHVLLTSNPNKEYNITYLSTAIKWAIRNELRYRYKWYSLKQMKDVEPDSDKATPVGETGEKTKVREAVYETILSVEGLMESENPYEVRDGSYTPEETTEMSELAKIIRLCMAKLPERDRDVLDARFFKNMRMREIGDKFGISPSRTSRVVQSALDKLKIELKRRGYTSEHFDNL